MLKVSFHRSVGARLFMVITGVVLLTITVNAWQNSRFFYTQLILRMQEKTMEETRKGASAVETILDSWVGQMAVVTNGISGISKQRYMTFARNFVGSNVEFVSFELVVQDSKKKRFERLGFLMTPNKNDPRFGAADFSKLSKSVRSETTSILKKTIAKTKSGHTVLVRNLSGTTKLPLVMVAMPFYVNGSDSLLWAVLTAWQSRIYAALPSADRSKAYLVDDQGRLLSSSDQLAMERAGKEPLPAYVRRAMKAKTPYGLNRWTSGGHHMLGAFTMVPNYRLRLVAISDGSAAVAAIQAIIKRTVLWAILLVLVAVVISVLAASGITRNLRDLMRTTLQIASGNFESAVRVRSRDEVGLLGHAVNHMGAKIVEHLAEKVEMVRIEQELETAQMVQDSFFPKETTLEDERIRISPFFSPASECGGDWWGTYRLSERYRLVCIADATGHGLPAALITAMSYAGTSFMARALEKQAVFEPDLLMQMMQDFNQILCEGGKRKFTMTYFALVLDLVDGVAYYVNAGHNFPLLIPQDEDDQRLTAKRKRRTLPLSNAGAPLGMNTECKLQVKTMEIAEGDRIFLYTDGLFECANPRGEQWGKRRFGDALNRLAEAPTGEIRDGMVRSAYGFFEGQPIEDDITVVVVQIGRHKSEQGEDFSGVA